MLSFNLLSDTGPVGPCEPWAPCDDEAATPWAPVAPPPPCEP